LSWEDIQDMTSNWAERIEFAQRLALANQDVTRAWKQEYVRPSLIADIPDEPVKMGERFFEWRFRIELIDACITAKLFKWKNLLICSPSGTVLKPDFSIFLHADRLDWCYWSNPVRETPEFRRLFELFDKKRVGPADIWQRFCFSTPEAV